MLFHAKCASKARQVSGWVAVDEFKVRSCSESSAHCSGRSMHFASFCCHAGSLYSWSFLHLRVAPHSVVDVSCTLLACQIYLVFLRFAFQLCSTHCSGRCRLFSVVWCWCCWWYCCVGGVGAVAVMVASVTPAKLPPGLPEYDWYTCHNPTSQNWSFPSDCTVPNSI